MNKPGSISFVSRINGSLFTWCYPLSLVKLNSLLLLRQNSSSGANIPRRTSWFCCRFCKWLTKTKKFCGNSMIAKFLFVLCSPQAKLRSWPLGQCNFEFPLNQLLSGKGQETVLWNYFPPDDPNSNAIFRHWKSSISPARISTLTSRFNSKKNPEVRRLKGLMHWLTHSLMCTQKCLPAVNRSKHLLKDWLSTLNLHVICSLVFRDSWNLFSLSKLKVNDSIELKVTGKPVQLIVKELTETMLSK